MTSCRICDSPLPEGLKACVVCGTALDRKPTSGATTARLDKAQAVALEAIGLEEAKGTDVSVARRILQKAEKERSNGHLNAALDMVKATARSVEISSAKARVEAKLAEAKTNIAKAQATGVETLAMEKSLVDATKALESGDMATAERLLRRTSAKKEQAQMRKRAEGLIKAAKKAVNYAHERGADAAEAVEELNKAEEAFRADDLAEVKKRCQAAEEKADQARRYARAETFLKTAMADVTEASRLGADVNAARRLVHDAREALKGGVYADVQRLSREIRQAAKEAKRKAVAANLIEVVKKDIKREEKKKSDVSAILPLVAEASKALEEGDYARVRAMVKEATNAVKDVAALRKASDSLESLGLDIKDLKGIGGDTSEIETLLKEAESAFKAKKPDEVHKLIVRARRSTELVREALLKAAVAAAVEKIVEKAGMGRLDSKKVMDLLRQVEDAALIGQAINIDMLIEKELALPDQERVRRALVRLERIRDLLVELRRTDIDIAGADELIAKARKQLDAGRFEDAEAVIAQLEELTLALKASLENSAKDLIEKSKAAVLNTEGKGIPVPEAKKFLENAEESFKQGKIYEALEFARLAHVRAEKALEFKEERLVAEEAAAVKVLAERTREIQGEVWDLQDKADELAKADVDISKIRGGLASIAEALNKGNVDEAASHLEETKKQVDVLWDELKASCERTLEKAKKSVDSAKGEGLTLPPMGDMLARGEQALNEGRLSEISLVVSSIEQIINASRAAQDKERSKQNLEKGKNAADRINSVRMMVGELKQANIDIADSEDVLADAEMALHQQRYEDVEKLVSELEKTASDLRAQLVVATKSIIDRAEKRLAQAAEHNLFVGEAKEILHNAKEALEKSTIDKAIEYASIAERKADDAIGDWEQQQATLRAKEEEVAKTEISRFKRLLSDLSRADIDILGASDAVEKAEKSFADGKYSEVPKALEETESLAQTLQEGLKLAATDLLEKSRKNLEDSKTEGLDVMRGEKVLVNAKEALDDQRYVETIEYTKVIGDIVETAKRRRDIRGLEEELRALQKEVDRAKALGIDVTTSNDMLRKAQEDLALGRFGTLQENARRISEIIASAQEVYVAARLKAMTNAIQECRDAGLETTAAETLYKKAEEAVRRRDLLALDEYTKQVEVLLSGTRRAAEAERIEKDIRAFEDMLGQAARVGVEVGDLRPIALQAREAVKNRNFSKAESLVAEGRSAVRDRRRKQFADRYETKMQNISTMIESAKRFGANVAEAERILSEASRALEKQDLNMADILVKQAEVSAGIQIQNFIKNRYPNILVRLTEEGVQSDEWNNVVMEVSNKGKLSARNVQMNLTGDVEVRGLKPIPELGVNETKTIEFGAKPKASGQVPLNIEVLYQRYFDQNKYELKDLRTLKVEQPGTYLVEDVFLVHTDGRLITHQTRKFRESIDEDIFSGMLTVVQDFVKDSFKQRTRIGLKRLEFGESKIILERSEHSYIAAVLVGEEPDLLPLYMAEVLKQIEDRYGHVLETWSGMMQELEGIDAYVAKLIFVTDKPDASLGALEPSPVTEAVKILRSSMLLEDDAQGVKSLLAEAKESVMMDNELTWQAINRVKEEALKAVDRFRTRMKHLRDSTHKYVDEMRDLGVDVSQAEMLMREADDAYEVGKFDKLQDIHLRIREGVEKAKDQQLAKRIESDLTGLIQDMQTAKAEGTDTTLAESFLSRIQDALEEKNYRLVDEYFRRARESLEESKKVSLLKKCREELDRLTSTVVEAKQLGVSVDEAESLLMKASEALQQERGQELAGLLEAAKSSATQRIQEHLAERYPRLFVNLPTGGLQDGRWNRYSVVVANRGNWPAKNIEMKLFGEFDVEGHKNIPSIGPNEKKTMDIGLMPKTSGSVSVDLQLFYQRPLDESRYELTESKDAKVEPAGTYVVEDVLLTHRDGRMIAYESRSYGEALSEVRAAKAFRAVQEFVNDVFLDRGEVGLRRMAFEAGNVLVEQGPNVRLATIIYGEEPRLLPLYMVDAIRIVEEKFGAALASWDGDVSKLDGVQETVRALFYASPKPGADVGPLSTSVVTAGARLAAKGALKGKGDTDFIDAARTRIETESYESALKIIDQLRDAIEKPAEQLTAEVKAAVLATKETIGLELSDEEIAAYVDILRQVLQAILRAKQKAGMESYWPVKRVAVKPSSQLGIDAVTSFRKIIVNQSLTKELDIVQPTETWRGMNVRVQVDTEALNRAYKLWAKKIEILLKSQEAWKIKSGIDKGEYAVGIDGQKVKIDREMVWFEESLPDSVVEEPYENGSVYVDTEMTEDILSEGYAKEIVRIIRDVRREMNIAEDRGISLEINASKGLGKMLKTWREFISSQTNSTDLHFIDKPPKDGYIVEATLGEENFALGVKSAEA